MFHYIMLPFSEYVLKNSIFHNILEQNLINI